MKKILFVISAIVAMSFASCGNKTAAGEAVDTVDTAVVDTVDTTVVDSTVVDTVAVDSTVAE